MQGWTQPTRFRSRVRPYPAHIDFLDENTFLPLVTHPEQECFPQSDCETSETRLG